MNDLISVIIPAYNAEKYLAEAIHSVLAQSYTSLEIIVVDDGSEDSTASVAQGFGGPVRVYTQPHKGSANARNLGTEIARGELIAFLDADDLWAPEKLTIQMEALRADPTLDAVFGHAQNFLETGDPAQPRKMLSSLPGPISGTMLIYKTALQRIGGFASGMQVGESVEFYIRAREMGLRESILPDIFLYRRIHGQNQGLRFRLEQQKTYTQILKAALDRKRGKRHRDE